MPLDFDIPASKARKFGLIEELPKIKDTERVLIEVNSIKETASSVDIDCRVSVRGKQSEKKIKYSINDITPEKATFAGWAFVLSYTERGGFYSGEKISEEEEKSLKNSAKAFLEIATKEDSSKSKKISCLPYYLIAKHHLYDYKDRVKTNLHKSLDCPDVFPDAYDALINLESYSVKKMLIAQEGLKKFPSEEKLVTEIIDYYVLHNENKKAIDLILSKKEIIPPNKWKDYKSLRLLLVFCLIKLKKLDEARKETKIPICENDFEKDANLFLKGFIEYEAGDYQKATDFFLDTIKISTYNSSEVRASYYFLLGCYYNLGQTSQLEELAKEFELASDYFCVEALRGFHYVENIRKIFKDIIKSEVNELVKAKLSGLLAFSYFQEIETNQQSIKNRAFWGGDLTKKEKERIKKNLSLLEDTLRYYPRVSFFNALYANLCNYIGYYDKAVKFDLKAIDGKENENMDAYSYTELTECSKEFIDNYAEIIKENVRDIDKYIEERLSSDINSLYEIKKYNVISEIYFYLKNQNKLDTIWGAETESFNGFLFRLAYSLNEKGHIKDASVAYKKHIEFYDEDSSVLNNLALIREKEGKLEEAKSLITKAKNISEENDEVVDRNYARLTSSSKKIQSTSEIIEKAEEIKSTFTPQALIEKGIGYFQFRKQRPKIKIGQSDSRHFRLLQFLSSPLGSSRTIDSVFDAIKLPKDKNDQMLNGYNTYQSIGRKIDLIEYAKKELQKNKELQGRLKFELDRNQKTYRLRLV